MVKEEKTAGSKRNYSGGDHYRDRDHRNTGEHGGHDDRASALCGYAEGHEDPGCFVESAAGEVDNGYYEQILPDNLSAFDGTKLTKDGTKLSNNTIKLCQDGTELAENGFMKIAYTKQATFDTANTTVQTILIDGVPKYSIRLVMDTGKHFVESN